MIIYFYYLIVKTDKTKKSKLMVLVKTFIFLPLFSIISVSNMAVPFHVIPFIPEIKENWIYNLIPSWIIFVLRIYS